MAIIEEEQDRATRVRDYWRSRGYDVQVQAGHLTDAGHAANAVRSNLVNGLPRNLRPELPVDVAVKVAR